MPSFYSGPPGKKSGVVPVDLSTGKTPPFLEVDADAAAPFVDVEALVAVLIELKVLVPGRPGEGDFVFLPGDEAVVVNVDLVEIPVGRERGSAAAEATENYEHA